jgi:type VI secretion system secreted protein VgrG
MAADVLTAASRAALAALGSADFHKVRWAFLHESDDSATWQVLNAQVRERLSEPYVASLELATDEAGANPMALVGAKAALLYSRSGVTQQLHGLVTAVQAQPTRDGVATISVRLEPALAVLAHTSDTRVFRDLTAPEIIEQVLNELLAGYGRSVNVDGLNRGDYLKREYTAQHRESALHFVSRLMEEEGITYFFRHPPLQDGDGDEPPPLEAEELVLVDDTTLSKPEVVAVPESAGEIPIVTRATDLGDSEAIFEVRVQGSTTPTGVMLRGYDWTRPRLDQPNSVEMGKEGQQRQLYVPEETLFSDYAEPSYAADDLQAQTAIHFDRAVQDMQVVQCLSNVTGMRPGLAFTTAEGSDLKGDFLVVAVHHASAPPPGTRGGETYYNRIECLTLMTPHRPRRRHHKPVVHGIQTALVVGKQAPNPDREAIEVDSHGRVKVQFQWDRLGEDTEKSSAFIRVAMPWAGNGYGVAFIPRVGMEVVVTFINGDPDRPVITGCLYNGDNAFPLKEGEATQSLIRTHSETGQGYNELRFEDKDGAELISVHAQKDYRELVEHDHTATIKHDQVQTVEGKQQQTIKKSQTESVHGNQNLSVGGSRHKKIKHDEEVTIEGNQIIRIKGSQSIVIEGVAETEGADFKGGGVGITGDYKMETSKTIEVKAPDSIKLIVADTFIEILPDKITLQINGGAKIVLDMNVLAQSADGSKLVLDPNALLQSKDGAKSLLDKNVLHQSQMGSKVVLDANALSQASTGGKLVLDMGALLKGMTATVQGDLTGELKAGTGSVKTDPVGATISGPLVKIN